VWRRIREIKPVLSAVGIEAAQKKSGSVRNIILTKDAG
jgi:hypothetical protein